MNHPAYAYLADDRLAALAQQRTLPMAATGAVLSVDVVGFTRITEGLSTALGARRGADSLAELLNQVYTILIGCVSDWNGSVVSFSGDAMRCWFPDDDGRFAVGCACTIHQALHGFDAVSLNGQESVTIAIKAAIVSGALQRLELGDPTIQIIDTLAGDLLSRLAQLETVVQPSEVLMDEPTATVLSTLVDLGSRRDHLDATLYGSILAALKPSSGPVADPARRDAVTVSPDSVRPWLLPGIWDRLQRGMGDFLTELRPAVALFGQFGGDIDDLNPGAIGALNRYVGWVQAVIARYDGVVLQITLGEKGNYFYASFGALQAHEDDAMRAVCAARDLQTPPVEPGFGHDLRVGIASGIMRTGVYGSLLRRTYGALGDAVNLAARLMQHAERDTILVSEQVYVSTADQVDWLQLDPIALKGKRDPVVVYRYAVTRSAEAGHQSTLSQPPLIGRQAEFQQMLGYLVNQSPPQGQALAVIGDAGIGKSRLITEVATAARQRGWSVYGSECQSYHQNTPYSVWHPLLRALLGIKASDAPDQQLVSLEAAVTAINPTWQARLPLLAPIINLAIPETELTRSFDAQLRNASREALVVDWFRGWVQSQNPRVSGIVLIFEDIHWIDPLSLNLLAAVVQVIAPLPVIVLLGYRPLDTTAALTAQLGTAITLPLSVLSSDAASELIAAKVAQFGQTLTAEELTRLVGHVYARTQGNPFYIEELLTYLAGNHQDLRDLQVWERSELPTSLHQLLLSRIDQLSPAQQETLKIASIIGRLFRVAWLAGYHPALDMSTLYADLNNLRAAEMLLLDTPEPGLAYLFRHVIAQEVTYESLGFTTRALLHEQLAHYLEGSAEPLDDQLIYLVTYHYERSTNAAKQREYFRRAGETAQAAYANTDAIRYYDRLLPLLDLDTGRATVLLQLGAVLELVGEKSTALERYEEALRIAQVCEASELEIQTYYAIGVYYRIEGDFDKALEVLDTARSLAIRHNSPQMVSIYNEIAYVYYYQGNFDQAKEYLAQNLRNQSSAGNSAAYGITYHVLSIMAKTLGDYEKAYMYARKSLEVNSKDGDILKYSNALNDLGNALLNHGETDRCLAIHEESLAIRRTIGAKRAIAVSCANIAGVHLKKYQLEAAIDRYRDALSIARELTDTYLLLNIMHCLGSALAQQGKFAEGKVYLDQSLHIAETFDSTWMKSVVYIAMSTFHSLQSNFSEVEYFSRKALAIYQELNDTLGTAVALGNLGSNSLQAGRHAEAREFLERGLALTHEVDEKFLVIYIHYYLGFLAIEEGDLTQAISTFKVCLSLVKQIGDTEGFIIGSIGLTYVQLQLDSADVTMQAAAVSIAAADRALNRTAAHLSAYIRGFYTRVMETVKQQLSPEQFAAAWEAGQALSMEQAVDRALADHF